MRSTSLLFVLMMFVTLIVAAPIDKRGSTYSGTGTWFLPATEGGSTGACGPKEGNNSPIVALNAPQYGNMSKKSSWCGKKIKITGPKGSVTATVNDACPECKSGDLDLTPVLFKKVIGDMNIGVGKIKWHAI
ncbi:RlpA-like double-psi beta-barrel-protein domain-containing protein-containing protein [Chlamydoabsidia padenii]|nr:RlpA-like double-psi beta-barrel-protein domain-containing protein-containing protein [Chlamydoabsidia padenii]